MVRRWQYRSSALYWLSVGIVALFLTSAAALAAPKGRSVSSARSNQAAKSEARTAGVPSPESAGLDWQALLQKVESLDTSKPGAVTELKGLLADLIRIEAAQAREIETLRSELEARQTASTRS